MSILDSLLINFPIFGHMMDMIPGVVLAAALFLCLLPWRKRRLAVRGLTSSTLREAALLLFWMFCGGMAVLTLTPRWFTWAGILQYGLPMGITVFSTDSGVSLFSPGDINLIPFQTFGQIRYVLLGNIIMFLPFGFFAGLLFRGFNWKRALLAGFCITIFIECWQLCVGRAFDIDDLMLNTLGTFCGWLLTLAVQRLSPGFAAKLLARPQLPVN